MIHLHVKPLSVNKVWMGRRFKTKEYKEYAKEVTFLLPDQIDIPDGKLAVIYEFGLSNVLMSDNDNPVKPFQDILSSTYGFNDNRIYTSLIKKLPAKKGFEYVKFIILPLNQLKYSYAI